MDERGLPMTEMPDSTNEAMRRPAQPVRPPAKQDRTTIVLLLAAAFIAVGGIGFATVVSGATSRRWLRARRSTWASSPAAPTLAAAWAA